MLWFAVGGYFLFASRRRLFFYLFASVPVLLAQAAYNTYYLGDRGRLVKPWRVAKLRE